MANLDAKQIISRAGTLKSQWGARETATKIWYQQLQMVDDLATKNLESFTSNDPRTFYNLAMFLLCSDNIPHKIPTEGLDRQQIQGTSQLEKAFQLQWDRIMRTSRGAGKPRFLRDLVGLMLVTGWYAVQAYGDKNGFHAEVWHPLQVFPEFEPEGVGSELSVHSLAECAHIYTISVAQAKRKLFNHPDWNQNVKLPTNLNSKVTVYDYWYWDKSSPWNAIIMDKEFVKEPTPHTELPGIPIVTAPVGGLPDRGVIDQSSTWTGHIGEGIFATNEKVLQSFNKQMTFIMQLLRDTAQSRWYEKSASGQKILSEEDIYKRGAIIRMGLQDDVGMVLPPTLPTELRTNLFDTGNMIQRGALPYTLYGNLQQQISSVMMTQIAASANQVLGPYHEGLEDCLTDIDAIWLWQIRNNKAQLPNFRLSPNIPNDSQFQVKYEINIPGDVISRATVARMLNPNFRLSATRIMDEFFPEIDNPLDEQSTVMAEDALAHPMAQNINLIKSFKDQANALREVGDQETAMLYESVAEQLKQQMAQAGQGASSSQPRQRAPMQQVQPTEATQPFNPADAGVV